MNQYTSLYASENSGKKTTLLKAIVSSAWALFKSYFLKKGFLYGSDGFIISFCNALGAFFKHYKLLEKNKYHKNKNIYSLDKDSHI